MDVMKFGTLVKVSDLNIFYIYLSDVYVYNIILGGTFV